jgi:phosphoenolpyruvate carboxykinase (ATP)
MRRQAQHKHFCGFMYIGFRIPLHPVFQVLVPQQVPGRPAEILDSKSTWEDPAAYDCQAADWVRRLAAPFQRYEDVDGDIRSAGLRV